MDKEARFGVIGQASFPAGFHAGQHLADGCAPFIKGVIVVHIIIARIARIGVELQPVVNDPLGNAGQEVKVDVFVWILAFEHLVSIDVRSGESRLVAEPVTAHARNVLVLRQDTGNIFLRLIL